MSTTMQINRLKEGFPVLALYCKEQGISNGKHVDVALTRDKDSWRGVRVYKNRIVKGVLMYNRSALLWWHEAIGVLCSTTPVNQLP